MKKQNGFTLVELMIAMAIFAIVISGVYVCYISQQKSYISQEGISAMQQNIRAAEIMLERDLRMAGYCNPNNPPPASTLGFITPATNNFFTITMDMNGNGQIDAAAGAGETIYYRLNNNQIERRVDVGGAWLPIAENIDALDFVYISGVSTVLNPGGGSIISGVTLNQITSVQITIVARAGRPEGGEHFNNITYTNQQNVPILAAPMDRFKRRLLTLKTQCRNLWYRV